jgi:hypothetical protein
VPFRLAVIVVDPCPTVVTAMAADVAPDAAFTGVDTVATDGLLLVRTTLSPPTGAGFVNVTLPWTTVPATAFVELNVTLDTPNVGPFGDLELHALPARMSASIPHARASDRPQSRTVIRVLSHVESDFFLRAVV